MHRFNRFLMVCIVPVAGLLAIDILSGGILSDPLFFLGSGMLLIGGTLQVIHAGVFDGFIRSFKIFRRHSVKLEDYVSLETDEPPETVVRHLPAFAYMAWTGALLIGGTGLIGVYIY